MLPGAPATAVIDASRRPDRRPDVLARAPAGAWLPVACAVAFAVALLARARLGLGAPLWLDETWTGAFAAQPGFGALMGQVRDDANAPLYYVLMWGWAKAFGVSNLALRAPGVALGLLAPVLAWLGLRRAHPSQAWVWAALLALWAPGIALSGYARCYPLLLCLAVATTAAYVRLLEAPGRRRAALWATAAAAMTLTHYHAGLLALVQGVGLLVILRRRALPLWPAAAAFLPAFAVIAWHAPRLAAFARPDVAWYDRVTLADLPSAAGFLVGVTQGLALVGACAGLGLVLARRDREAAGVWAAGGRAPAPPAESDRAMLLAGATALVAAGLCVAAGMVRPSFTLRYLTPFAPGALLFAAGLVRRAGRGRGEPQAALVAGFALVTVMVCIAKPPTDARAYNFEAASAWIAPSRPDRLVFFWDHPAAPVEAPAQLDAVGGFFLRRARVPITVAPLYPAARSAAHPAAHSAERSPSGLGDMNGPALAATRGARSAVLWLYDVSVRGVGAGVHPPRLAALDPALECRDFGAADTHVYACRPRTAPSAALPGSAR